MNHPYNIQRPGGWFKFQVPGFKFQVSSKKTADETRNTKREILEAVLFLAREPLPLSRLTQIAELSKGTQTKKLLKEINEQYDREQTAFCVVEVADGYQLRTRPEFAPYIVRFQENPSAVKLSQPMMETLAVIAYKQPVSRADVDSIRGIQCGDLIRQLLDLELVKIAGRSGELGKPFLYATTKKFLQIFGLRNLDEL